MPSESVPHRMPRWKRTLFVSVVLLFMVGLAEVAARAVDAFTGISVQEHRERYAHRRLCRLEAYWPAQRGDYPYLPYVPNPRDPRVNDLSFRGEAISADRPARTYRVFCLGGSTTWDEYPAFLQAELAEGFAARGLSLEVINGGNVLWTSMESLISFITRGLPLRPDAIIVYHATNDATPAFGETASPDYSHWRGRLEKNEPLVWDKLPAFWDHSAAYVGLRALFERKVPTLGWNEMTTRYNIDLENSPYNGVEPYRQNIYSLICVARGRGIETFLCTQVFNHEFKHKHSFERFSRAVEDVNRITRSFAGRWDDVHVIDAAGLLKGGNDWMTDTCHFTPEGKLTLTRFIASGVRSHLDRLVARRGDPCDVAALIPPNARSLAGGRALTSEAPCKP